MEYSLRSTKEELTQSRSRVEELSQTIQQVQSEKPDSAKLNAAMESDKLAAQKATAQNAKMKLDLQHLEKAFEQMVSECLLFYMYMCNFDLLFSCVVLVFWFLALCDWSIYIVKINRVTLLGILKVRFFK